MIRFYFLSVLFFLGAGGLFAVWLERMQDWGWLVATIAWIVVSGGFLFDQAQRWERRPK